MPQQNIIKFVANNRQGMTVAELRDAVAALGDVDGSVIVAATVRMNGALRELKVDSARKVVTLNSGHETTDPRPGSGT